MRATLLLLVAFCVGGCSPPDVTVTTTPTPPLPPLAVVPRPATSVERPSQSEPMVVRRVHPRPKPRVVAPRPGPKPKPKAPPPPVAFRAPELPPAAGYPRADQPKPSEPSHPHSEQTEPPVPSGAPPDLPAGNARAALRMGLYSTASDNDGQRLSPGSLEKHWQLVKFEQPPGTLHAVGTRFYPGCALYTVTSIYDRPALSPEKTGHYGPVAPLNGYYTYETNFTVSQRPNSPVIGKILVDDAILEVYLNGQKLPLQFTGGSTSRTIDGKNFADYYERGTFELSNVRRGRNQLRVVTMNQLLGRRGTPHSFETNFDEALGDSHPRRTRRRRLFPRSL
jgi:hypothetical protein